MSNLKSSRKRILLLLNSNRNLSNQRRWIPEDWKICDMKYYLVGGIAWKNGLLLGIIILRL